MLQKGIWRFLGRHLGSTAWGPWKPLRHLLLKIRPKRGIAADGATWGVTQTWLGESFWKVSSFSSLPPSSTTFHPPKQYTYKHLIKHLLRRYLDVYRACPPTKKKQRAIVAWSLVLSLPTFNFPLFPFSFFFIRMSTAIHFLSSYLHEAGPSVDHAWKSMFCLRIAGLPRI